jgi:hypothetical protein
MNSTPIPKKSHLLYWARPGHKTYIGSESVQPWISLHAVHCMKTLQLQNHLTQHYKIWSPPNDFSNGVPCSTEQQGKLFSQFVPSTSPNPSGTPEAKFINFQHSLSNDVPGFLNMWLLFLSL